MSRAGRMVVVLGWGVAGGIVCGCGGGEGAAGGGADPGGAAQVASRWPARATDPRVVEARSALDEGRLDLAEGLVEQAAPLAGTEAPLLRARLETLRGDEVQARRALEDARRAAPEDPRVSGAAAEVAAAFGHMDEAERALQQGLKQAGGEALPELLRARGVLLICTPGQARPGLEFLQQADAAAPGLPFLGRVLGQAHLLVAKEKMQAGDREGALAEVEASLERDPWEVDAKRFRAECLMALGEWGRAIRLYEELIADGEPLQAEVAVYAKNAGFWAKTQGERELALKYYRLALELGLERAALGTGVEVLIEGSADLVEEATGALAGGDAERAMQLVGDALELDPESPLAMFSKGCVHEARGEWGLCEAAWMQVLSMARSQGLELPQPVHISLARVQALEMGKYEEARRTLEGYLLLEPAGRWVDQTRALLEKLPEEK